MTMNGPTRSVAVFLGPSLPLERARCLLEEADYYPPAQMGDIYRLIASGVSRIVLIDGLFHSVPEVWPREILEAMSAGIEVIGASSMGALRAAELHGFGMTGIGTVFEWYRDGVIDGDDEVAIAHAEADEGYRPLSEALVNIRHNLERAVLAGDLDLQQARELAATAKQTFFRDRSYRRLLRHDVLSGLPEEAGDTLRAKLQKAAVNLKQQDAISALRHVRALLDRDAPPARSQCPPASPLYFAMSKRKRGFVHPGGQLVSGEALWERLRDDNPRLERYRDRAAETFYLQQLVRKWGVACPEAYVRTFEERHKAQHEVADNRALLVWLRANGLTSEELHTLLRDRAEIAWLLEQGPAAFGIDPARFARLPSLWARLAETHEAPEARAAAVAFVAHWAQARGIACPEAEIERLRGRLVRSGGDVEPDDWRPMLEDLACYRWLIRKQPYAFGYNSWSPITAVLEELQITGVAAQIAAQCG